MGKSDVFVKNNPKLKQRELKNGKIALYLEYYRGRSQEPKTDENGQQMYYETGKMAGKPIYKIKHLRDKEELKLYLIAKPRTQEEREQNRETLQLAEKIRQEREQLLLADTVGYRLQPKKSNIMSFFDDYIARYTLKDIRNMQGALNRFKSFLREYRPSCAIQKKANEIAEIEKEWKERHKNINGKHDLNPNAYYRFTLNPQQLTEEMMRAFVAYLSASSTGSGAASYFERFKKAVKAAYKEGYLKINPCENVVCKRKDSYEKDILSEDEIVKMLETRHDKENPHIRRAFIFSLFTGVRFCDVKELRYTNIDFTNQTLKFEQAKTKNRSSKSVVEMPLRSDILEIVGTPQQYGKCKTDKIFDLPSHTMCLKALRRWTERAGIDKHITWHCARHSFGTNILINGANIKVVQDLLGHSDLKYTQRYVRAIDEGKRAALDSLPPIKVKC